MILGNKFRSCENPKGHALFSEVKRMSMKHSEMHLGKKQKWKLNKSHSILKYLLTSQ